MAEMLSIKMSKFDNQPWGFRLQGGIDFCAPLTVQKVNGGSLAEKAGLRVGDALIRVNTTDIFQLRHKEAQDAVARAGNNFELVVSRGGGMPKTAVKPNDVLDNILPVAAPPAPVQQPLIHKSLNLTAKPFVRCTYSPPTSVSYPDKKAKESSEFNNNNNNNNYLTSPPFSDKDYSLPNYVSSSYNSLPKCYGSVANDETNRAKELLTQQLAVMRIQPTLPPVRSANSTPLVSTPALPSSLTLNKCNSKTDGSGVKIVNRQFNSPMGLYSEESIAETLSSQAEVLSQGVLGVNFKKNDKTYDPGNSEVFKMIQEMDKAPKEPEPGIDIDPADASPAQKGLASRTIQSRTFQRIHQQALRSLETSSSSNPTSPILSPNTSMEERHQGFAHSATPTHKPMSFNSPVTMVANNFGGSALSPSAHHPPPVGGVRIFPAAPAPVKPQVKIDELFEQVESSNTISSMMSTIVSSSSSSVHQSASTITTIEETVAVTNEMTSDEPAAVYGPPPPAVKSVSFTPAARPSGGNNMPPANFSGNRVVWPPVASEPEETYRNVVSPAFAPPSAPLQQNTLGVVDSDGIPFVLDGFTPSPFAAPTPAVANVVEPPAPTPAVVAPVAELPVPTPVVEAPVRMPSPVASGPYPTLTGLKAGPSVLGYGGDDDGTTLVSKQTDIGQMQQQQHQHEPSNPGLAGFGSAAAVAASAAMAAQAQHQAPQLAPQPPKGAGSGIQSAPRRGKGVLNQQVAAGARVPVCSSCKAQIRGKFVTALGQTWCPNHFSCAMPDCKRELHDIGFVEEKKQLYCEGCFETHLAPNCSRCSKRVKGDCLNAIGKQFHPECFSCTYCGSLFGNSHFYLEDGLPYCEADWNELFTTKCYACGYPIEAGDRWVEAMNNNYHSQCFNCSVCKKNLEGQSFLGKGGRPMCKSHAR
ncbi:LIM domain-binding protein 3 isoform X1 [Daphnia magna]|uniref:LIM domain-binding protein 3 isoform X1 n=1 Tax=Daphnia magna TaxID=35525 RepID=UPI001E1BAC69|nr:LIM domain-binding protein 3 isoform X1 [Daphnia magna]